ncbi:hypothetical protein CP556_24615 [Natrinema sp. CBA1119]|uniref:helicase-related protein n=1 Tax=Natrinema sp. CBA1119 TaxID=1608465 RepID=UPI000BF94B72|nr:helicase-related protein [Natrinema sp. CBA1119]PGF14202.1 hypothetical protein CP556_24615 [Natrinema sp. CBA1119]
MASKVPNSFVVHGHLSNEDTITQIANFRGRDSGALVAPMLLDEGIDVPDADVGINVAGTKSRLQLVQRMGRILRPGGKIRPVFHHFAHPAEIDLYYSLGPIEPTVTQSVTPQITERLPRRIGPIQLSQALSMISPDQAQQLLRGESIIEELRTYSDNRWWLSFLADDYPDEFESWLQKRAHEHSSAET